MNEYQLLLASNLLNLMVASPAPITFTIFESSDAVVYHADRTQNIHHTIRDLKSFLMDYSRHFRMPASIFLLSPYLKIYALNTKIMYLCIFLHTK